MIRVLQQRLIHGGLLLDRADDGTEKKAIFKQTLVSLDFWCLGVGIKPTQQEPKQPVLKEKQWEMGNEK